MERMILKSIQVNEEELVDGKKLIHYSIDSFGVEEFNLLIGDNAQGKTRLFNIVGFLSELVSDKPKIIRTNFKATLLFEVGSDKVEYSIHVKPGKNERENYFYEIIKRKEAIIFHTRKEILLNEKNGKKIKTYFIPENIPAIRAIEKPQFKTIALIRDFLSRIVFVAANKSREIHIDPDAIKPNPDGSNIAFVLSNWQKSYERLFNETINEIKDSYPFIKKVLVSKGIIGSSNIKTTIISIKEDGVAVPIPQYSLSDGITRLMHLIMTVQTPFGTPKAYKAPSLVFIDEIENGIDFNCLQSIIKYLMSYSDDMQVFVSSHSPIVCELVNPKYWKIVKRKGTDIRFSSPKEIESSLEESLNLFEHKHWEFYSKHISNSKLYQIE